MVLTGWLNLANEYRRRGDDEMADMVVTFLINHIMCEDINATEST